MLAFVPAAALAKRGPAAKVDPVVHEGVRYLAPNDNGRRAIIQAWDVKANQMTWDVTVFTTPIDPALEEDVQWVFIRRMFLAAGKLIVIAETGQAYSLELKTRAVEKLKQVPEEKK